MTGTLSSLAVCGSDKAVPAGECPKPAETGQVSDSEVREVTPSTIPLLTCVPFVCRQGAVFVEGWVDGFAFTELSQHQKEITRQREELEKQRRLLGKRKVSLTSTSLTGRHLAELHSTLQGPMPLSSSISILQITIPPDSCHLWRLFYLVPTNALLQASPRPPSSLRMMGTAL